MFWGLAYTSRPFQVLLRAMEELVDLLFLHVAVVRTSKLVRSFF